ncbi:hypothetical protein HD554DRAFT_2143532 [Boletus coccyginus]|nr:hypothetical protein HD554DRAFT_2143532 [Boletus coccyginus]
MDPPFPSTVHEILSGLSKFRILVVGKSGCGKSALLSKVFGVDDPSPENGDLFERLEDSVSPKIQGGFTFHENGRFVLYTSSRDFSPNSDTDFDKISGFIHTRLQNPQKALHAVWICMGTPLGGERLSESGVERVLEVAHKKVPVVIVLTKFDLLVDSITTTEKTSDLGCDDEIDEDRETAEHLLDDTLKKISLDSLLSQQLVVPVSSRTRYEDTISTLIQSTDSAIQRFSGKRTHDSPIALAWAIAQRQDLETTVAATIDVGCKKHWSKLCRTTTFRGRMLEQCVSIIHEDIIAIWNIQDGFSYLGGEDFKARMSHLAGELAHMSQNETAIPTTPGTTVTFAAATANHISAIGAVTEAAKWVSDVYQATPNNIACIMGYIADLIIVLIFLSEIHQFPETVSRLIEDDAVNAIKAYISSGLLSEAHKEIRQFVAAGKWYETTERGDGVLKEIVRLVNKFHLRARGWVKNVYQKLPSPTISISNISDVSDEQPVKGESVRSHRLPSVRSRVAPRRSAQEPPPDILTIVEEATRSPTARSSSEGSPHPTLLIPEISPAESSKHSPLNPLNWVRRERHGADEEAGRS